MNNRKPVFRLVIGGTCRAKKNPHVLLSDDDIYVEPSSGNKRCKKCFIRARNRAKANARKSPLIEPDIRVARVTEIPMGIGRVERGTWDRLALAVSTLQRKEAYRIAVAGNPEKAIRDAATKIGVKVQVFTERVVWVVKA